MKPMIPILALLLVCFLGDARAQTDSDHDGLPDSYEQLLLETYRPTFMISASDCAGRPAKFKPGQILPEVLVSDGTIYGQAFPSSKSSSVAKDMVEIHYYTLWSRDCGRLSHAFDVEHVSALVNIGDHQPKALYWYAGAHEETVCDISSGSRAKAVDGENKGPTVWSSSGKHALYLRQEMCKSGCGADSCTGDLELKKNGPVVNVGERKFPANGSLWVDWLGWKLSEKMDVDFTRTVVAKIEASPEASVITLRGRSTVRGTIQGSNKVLDKAQTGAGETGDALSTADSGTSSGVAKAARATGRSLKRAWKAVLGKTR